MAPRACLPGEMFLDAIHLYPARQLDVLSQGHPHQGDWAIAQPFDQQTVDRVQRRGDYIALHWVLNTALGIPLEPFTVWRRPVPRREAATPIFGWHRSGFDTFAWDGVTEMLHIELDVSAATTAWGLSRSDNGSVATASGAAGTTIVLEGGPMLGVRLDNPGAVIAARGLSSITMANGAGWTAFEIVGLPFGPTLAGTTYYANVQQGPLGALTDPVTAAATRLKNWGPVIGWAPLTGLPAWRVPDPGSLVQELQGDVLGGLVQVLQASPAPQVGHQYLVEVTNKLAALRQVVGLKSTQLNQPGDNQRSEIRIRPLQALSTAVASDVWASLALGFGTGADPRASDHQGSEDDFMVTTRWSGEISIAVPTPWPWPWLNPPPPRLVTEQVERELAAVVLAPKVRSAPALPSPVAATVSYAEGALDVDLPYRCASAVRTTRPQFLPNAPRVSAVGMARFDHPGSGQFAMREHRLAKGWIPLGAAVPVRQPEQPLDPELVPNTIMLRDSGIPMPISGAALSYQYTLAASDLFGQWSPWSGAWLSVGPALVQAPSVSVLRVHASPGAGDTDPCSLQVTAEVVWDRRERTCSRMHIVVDVTDPLPPPPAALADPPGAPQPLASRADVLISFDADGTPVAPLPAGVTVAGLHEDDTPVTPASPDTSRERRYRVSFSSVPVTYAGAPEKAVALYAQSEETIRPGEWSGWAHTREYALAPNPIPPPTPLPLPAEYPLWASLPDAAGLSYAPVTWTPTGAWRYRVYEATEAALLSACGAPGPVLTQGYGSRMQALFDLYKNAANLDKLKSAYRKLGDAPVSPPLLSDGTMRFESLLPRGSRVIHCYIVAGVSETNVLSAWPQSDVDGRHGFLAYAIPTPVRAALPEILARLPASNQPEVTVRVGGAVPATRLQLYRAVSPQLARAVGTMQLISTVNTDPAAWQQTVMTDPAAPPSWSRLQYRAVALTQDDLDHAGMAVPSLPSRTYALLKPPPDPPTLALVPNVAGTTATQALVRLDTDAARPTTDVGDHVLAWIVTTSGVAPVRSTAALAHLPIFPTIATLLASTEVVAYVGSAATATLYMCLARLAGQALDLTVDLTDPLGRQTHRVADVPMWVPDPAPVIANFTVGRTGGAVGLSIDTNVPLPPDPTPDWTFKVAYRDAGVLFGPSTRMSFSMAAIVPINQAVEMPNPALVPDHTAIRRLGGRILMWIRSPVALRVGVELVNSENVTATDQRVTP